ncbi:MAG: hypothetical protein IKO91_07410 [Oscillospiraceae bacterium]|nr:hypothetical protein [Oscillospiraceae bacterium]
MNELEFLDALGGMDEKYIREAAESGISPGKRVLRWGVLAACLCLAALTVYLGSTEVFRLGQPVRYANASSSSLASAPVGTETAAPSPTVTAGTESAPPAGVYIPVEELPEGGSGGELDMIGLVVYGGGVYTQALDAHGEEARVLDALTGEYLGEATGTIDEWSTQDAYSKEFAGTVSGPLYAVDGYDTDFRICLRQEYVDEDGESRLWLQYLERLNGVTLTAGAELFEDRLHLRGRVTEIRWQDWESWYYSTGEPRDAALAPETWDAFLEELDRGEFVKSKSISRETNLYLRLEDGLTVRLRLLAGGYVSYPPLRGAFVKMPGEIFDTVYAACGGK